jgi:hypothetical protein
MFDHLQAMQRISDTWRSRIGSTAISVVNTFLDSSGVAEELATDESRQEFAKTALESFGFLYSDTESADPKVCDLNKYDTCLARCTLHAPISLTLVTAVLFARLEHINAVHDIRAVHVNLAANPTGVLDKHANTIL